ncbi:hypothetical protein LLEC1_07404 [Akanthomyces lecanii]|uniref:Protein kinase domain-containing protein n=1 Tax=Cordyceps confragosa TaxID=2714763 RepID=A0A179IF47_CORDF|nr:hypothetical protein LLEC1_07404 [Akanthomyces lecanii]
MPFAKSEKQHPTVTAGALLAFDDGQLDQFLTDRGISSLSSLPGVLELSTSDRSCLAQRIRSTLNQRGDKSDSKPIDANELAQLLADLAQKPTRSPLDVPPRSPTESIEHTDYEDYEDLCRQELVKDGGHPACTLQELRHVCAEPKISNNAILAWLSDETDTETGARERTTVFSRQLERWWDFRKSQWKHRTDGSGKGDSGDKAFTAYLDAKTRIYEGSGAPRMVSDASFEKTIRRQWEALSAFRQLPKKQSFSAYRDAMQMRIGRHQFDPRGLQLREDVRQQDSWATLLEYLNYETWYGGQLTAKAESLESAFFASWRLLTEGETDSNFTSNGWQLATKASSLEEELQAARAERDACRRRIGDVRRVVGQYRKARYAAYRQRVRTDWIVDLAHAMENKMPQRRNGSTASNAHVPEKRRRDDPKPPRKRAKPRAAGEHSAPSANTSGSPTGTHHITVTLSLDSMEDIDHSDVIVFLRPLTDTGRFTVSMPRNEPRFLKACQSLPSEVPRHEREGTELPEESDFVQSTDRLVVKFSQGCETRHGVVCGEADSVDLALPDMPKISRVHLAITFDEKTNRPVIRDLGSTCGTVVTFDGERGTSLSNYECIAKDKYPFKVVVPTHDFTSPGYIEKVRKFRLGTAEPEELLHSLVLQSRQRTQQPGGQRTPYAGPICYERLLGQGAFSEVIFVWEIKTGEEYVVKRPHKSQRRHTDQFFKDSWINEAEIMKSISHISTGSSQVSRFEGYPQLRLEYIPRGSLAEHKDLSEIESAKILCQLSSAVEYLHNRNLSIVHRDIKPENILVAERTQKNIHVKFADFGLSKASNILKTYCGTPLWAAPELYLKAADLKATKGDTYTPAIDIWSLGVVIASFLCGLPTYTEEYNDQNSLLWLVIDSMLCKDPDTRSSADYIHDEARKIVGSMVSVASAAPVCGDDTAPAPKLGAVSEASTLIPEPATKTSGEKIGIRGETASAHYVYGRAPTPELDSVSAASNVDLDRKSVLDCAIMPLEDGLRHDGSRELQRRIADTTSSAREREARSNLMLGALLALSGESIVSGQLGGVGSSESVGNFRWKERESMCKRDRPGNSSGSSSLPLQSVSRTATAIRKCIPNDGRCNKRSKTHARNSGGVQDLEQTTCQSVPICETLLETD